MSMTNLNTPTAHSTTPAHLLQPQLHSSTAPISQLQTAFNARPLPSADDQALQQLASSQLHSPQGVRGEEGGTPTFSITAPSVIAHYEARRTDDLTSGDRTDQDYEPFFKQVFEMGYPGVKAYAPQPQNHPYNPQELPVDKTWELFKSKTDDALFKDMQSLLNFTARFKLNGVASDFLKQFRYGDGGEYSHPRLNAAIEDHPALEAFKEKITDYVHNALYLSKGAPETAIKKASQDILNNVKPVIFDTFTNKLGGLGILVHGTMGYKVDLLDYQSHEDGSYDAKIKLSLYDHFGLDDADVAGTTLGKKGPMYLKSSGFMAWHYLQHVRGYEPFTTVMEHEYDIQGNWKEPN